MVFPIHFSKPKNLYDVSSPIKNFVGNSAVLTVGGISVGAILFLGLKALGVGTMTALIASAVPVSAVVVGGLAFLGVGCVAGYLVIKGTQHFLGPLLEAKQ